MPKKYPQEFGDDVVAASENDRPTEAIVAVHVARLATGDLNDAGEPSNLILARTAATAYRCGGRGWTPVMQRV